MTESRRIWIIKVVANVSETATVVAGSEDEAIEKVEDMLLDSVRNEGADSMGDIECVFSENIHDLELNDLLEELKEHK